MTREIQQIAIEPQTSGLYGTAPLPIRSEPARKLKVLLEVTAWALLATAGLAVFGGDLGAKIAGCTAERRAARGAALVADTTAAIAAYPFEVVRVLQGASFLDGPSAETSEFRVELSVSAAGDGLVRVDGVLMDNRMGAEVRRFTTCRARV